MSVTRDHRHMLKPCEGDFLKMECIGSKVKHLEKIEPL